MLPPVERTLLRHRVASHRMKSLRDAPENRERKYHPTLLSPQRLEPCSYSPCYGSMRRIMGSYLIGAHKAGDLMPSDSDFVHVVLNRCLHKNCSRSHGIPPLRGFSMPSLTAQQFHRDHGVLFSVPWKHSLRTLSTTASVLESARAVGRRLTHISKYVTYFLVLHGPE